MKVMIVEGTHRGICTLSVNPKSRTTQKGSDEPSHDPQAHSTIWTQRDMVCNCL